LKYLLVLLVVGIGLWSLLSRLRGKGGGQGGGRPRSPNAKAAPVVMVECAHCGLHLPAADALPEGSRLYCSDAHRRLGPAPTAPR
jgi:uncharacterized protein